MTTRRCFGAILLASLLSSGCGGQRPPDPVWNQFHADSSGTGAVFAGTKAADGAGVVQGQPGPIWYSSPAIAPDGRAYVATFEKTDKPWGESALLRLSTPGSVAVQQRFPLSGQTTSPAVDAAGNVYVTSFMTRDLGSALHSFGPSSENWRIAIVPGRSLSPPRVFQWVGQTLIFVTYTGGTSAGGHLLVASDGGSKLVDLTTCNTIVGGESTGFHVKGVDLGQPYSETAAVAIRTVPNERGNNQTYVVAATDGCGIAFLKLNPGPRVGGPPTLTPVALKDRDESLWSPAIGADGTVVVADSNKGVKGYDVRTGNEKWHYDATAFIAAAPTLAPIGADFVYIASYERLIKLRLSDGTFEKDVPLPITAVDRFVDASPAAAGSLLFVSTSAGLATFDLDLNLKAFQAFPAGRSSPAIGPRGEVHAASVDGWYRVFPGF